MILFQLMDTENVNILEIATADTQEKLISIGFLTRSKCWCWRNVTASEILSKYLILPFYTTFLIGQY